MKNTGKISMGRVIALINLPNNHQEMLDAEHYKEFFSEFPHLSPRKNDTPSMILGDFYVEYHNRGDMYDEEMGELFNNMMERYKRMLE